MPEGPTIVILKESLLPFTGKRILKVEGKADNIDFTAFKGKHIITFKSWGKHLLICLPDCTLKIHLMLFGSWLINSHKTSPAGLSLQFERGEINFYGCAVERIDGPLNEIYDWSEDVMSTEWDPYHAIKKLINNPGMMVCDALLNQHIFSGVGNIIKNEVLFRTHIHPESMLGKIPANKLKELVKEAVNYSHQFYSWRKVQAFQDHWLIYEKRICPQNNALIENQILGKSRRRCYFCPACQKLYI